METLWSMSTTVREGERIVGFLKTANELEGEKWNEDSQIKFQTLLIKNREYLNTDGTQTFNKLSNEQIRLLSDKSIKMTYDQAKEIFNAKEYEDPSMRGRQSMSPLVKLGLVYMIGDDKIITISDVGKKLINDEIGFEDFMLEALLKFQYPHPYESGYQTWNTKPFINTLRLIKKVNELCYMNGMKEKGISTTEFGIFGLSLKNYNDVDEVAEKLLKFRSEFESYNNIADRNDFRDTFIKNYLADFNNPVKNVREYTDNMVRYLRLTKYIFIRGKYSNTYIDLEPRRIIEIDSILSADNGSAKEYSQEEWRNYMGVYGTYRFPFETIEVLSKIANELEDDIHDIEHDLSIENTSVIIPTTKEELKQTIKERRKYRTKLQNLEIKKDYRADVGKIDEVIESLEYIKERNSAKLSKKFSIELEKWSNIALNIINDSKFIKPNAPVGDDNEPIYTAPSKVADIECYYESFNAICEVTMLMSRDQWYNEGQPVMEHLRTFENRNSELPSYCLFIAPTIHQSTLNTFYTSVKYEYEGVPQRIIPITISQLESILTTIKEVIIKGKQFKHTDLMSFYNSCIDVSKFDNSLSWLEHISNTLNIWENSLIS